MGHAKPPAPDPADPPQDRAEFERITDGDRALQVDVLRAFFGEYPGVMEAARQAIEADHPAAVRNAAHKIRGALLNLAAGPAAAAALELEMAARAGDLPGCRRGVERLAVRLASLRTVLADRAREAIS